MKYTAEQLKDLLLLSQGACWSRDCNKCMWWKEMELSCYLLVGGPQELAIHHRVQKEAKQILREIIGNEHEIHN